MGNNCEKASAQVSNHVALDHQTSLTSTPNVNPLKSINFTPIICFGEQGRAAERDKGIFFRIADF